MADSPFVFGPRFFRDKGSVKVASRESTAYGEACFKTTFGSSSEYIIHTVTVTTKTTRKQPRGSYGQWGFSAVPGQESGAGLQSKGLANVSVAVANGALAFPD